MPWNHFQSKIGKNLDYLKQNINQENGKLSIKHNLDRSLLSLAIISYCFKQSPKPYFLHVFNDVLTILKMPNEIITSAELKHVIFNIFKRRFICKSLLFLWRNKGYGVLFISPMYSRKSNAASWYDYLINSTLKFHKLVQAALPKTEARITKIVKRIGFCCQ